jgi:nucleoside-diphosphate-sugar epimerase
MQILITGSSGFLGRYGVAEALRQGYRVQAGVRSIASAQQLSWATHPAVNLVPLDLQQPEQIRAAVAGVDAVIHVAAVLQGDYHTQYQGTVVGTENLLAAMTDVGVRRCVGISTFSVYDYWNQAIGTTIQEDSPIESHPEWRDGYARTKLMQENLLRQFGQQGGQVTILRPGIIYGRDHLWHASLGLNLKNRLWLKIGANAELPLIYVENCAAAIVSAVNCPEAIGQTLNLVDDDRPTQTEYLQRLLPHCNPKPVTLPVSWSLINAAAQPLWQVSQTLMNGKLKLPGLLIPPRLHARFKPFRYSNVQAKTVLNWQPRYSLDAAIDRSTGTLDLLTVQPNPTPSVSRNSEL